MSAALVGEQRAVVWYTLYRSPLSASRWKLGVWIGPPKVLLAPKPTSSVRISRTLGAPAGASTPLGKSGTEPFRVRSIFPLKGGSGVGNTLGVSDAAARGRALDATADAAMRDVEPSSRRRLISSLPAEDGAFDFLSDWLSLIVSSRPTLRTATLFLRRTYRFGFAGLHHLRVRRQI